MFAPPLRDRAYPRTNRHVKQLIEFLEKQNKEEMKCSLVVKPETGLINAGDDVKATLQIRAPEEADLQLDKVFISVGAFT